MKAKNILFGILAFSFVVVMLIGQYTFMANSYDQPVAFEFNQSFDKSKEVYNITERAFESIDTDTTNIFSLGAGFVQGGITVVKIMGRIPSVVGEITYAMTNFFHLPSAVAPMIIIFFVMSILFLGYYAFLKVKAED